MFCAQPLLTLMMPTSHVVNMSVDDVIEIAGGIIELAKAAGVDRTSVYGWQRKGVIPHARVYAINLALGIPLHELRPDLWPLPCGKHDMVTA